MIVIKNDKIKSIKSFRAYCNNEFGVEPGLMLSKQFVEGLIPAQDELAAKLSRIEDRKRRNQDFLTRLTRYCGTTEYFKRDEILNFIENEYDFVLEAK